MPSTVNRINRTRARKERAARIDARLWADLAKAAHEADAWLRLNFSDPSAETVAAYAALGRERALAGAL